MGRIANTGIRRGLNSGIANAWGASGGGFDPVGADLITWWDASDAATITETSGLVDSITDKKGSFTLTATTTERPEIGTRTLNGLDVLDFQGAQKMRNNSMTDSQPVTIFMVLDLDTVATNGIAFDGISGRWVLQTASSSNLAFFAGSILSRGPSATGYQILAIVVDNTNSAIYRNNTIIGATGAAGANSLTGFTLGGTDNGTGRLDGAIGEFRIYNGVLSTADITTVYDSLTAKWGTP